MDETQWEKWKIKVDPVLVSKVEEWHLLGYEQATKEEVWDCFMAKLPRLDIPDPVSTSWLVAALFQLKANDYMNWLTLAAYKGPNWFNDDEPIEFNLPQRNKNDKLNAKG